MEYIILAQWLCGGAAASVVAGIIVKLLLAQKADKLGTAKLGKNLKIVTGNGGFRISKKHQLTLKQSFENVVCIAPIGEGKTEIIKTNLKRNELDLNSSLIITDPKGTLWRSTSDYQKSLGRIPILYEPLNPLNSICINMLDFANDVTEIEKLATDLIANGCLAVELATGRKSNDSDFINMAIPLLTAMLLYVKEKGYPVNNIPSALQLLINTDDEALKLLFENSSINIRNQYNIFKSAQGADRTIGSIKVTLCSNLRIFLNPNIIKTSYKSEFNPEELRNKKIALYIKYDIPKANYIAPLMAVFTEQLFNIIMKKLPDKDDLNILFMLEELQNIGYICSLPNVAASLREYRGALFCSIQSVSGLQQIYGREKTTTILNNLKCKVILPSITDTETLNYISLITGTTQINIPEEVNGKLIYHKSKKALFEASELRTLDKYTALIIINNLDPVIDKLEYIEGD